LRLNKYIREQESWTATEMERRGKQLATKAVRVWPALQVDMGAVREAELEDRRLQAARYRLEDIKFDSESKVIFDQLRPQILALGKDVLELCGAKTVTYRVYDFFVEVIPRRRKLFLNLNLDYEECDDPSGRVSDAGEWSFITHAAESGGVVFSLQEASQIASALHVIRQAYENISE